MKYLAHKRNNSLLIGESSPDSFSFQFYLVSENSIGGIKIGSIHDWQTVLADPEIEIRNEKQEKLLHKGAFWQLVEDKTRTKISDHG